MGLSVEVGVLAQLLADDPEGAEWLSDGLKAASVLVVEQGADPHVEPQTLPVLESRARVRSYPYSFLHYLRRAYAYAVSRRDWVFEPVPVGNDPAKDPVVEDETFMMESHLLCHSDSEGFYLPVDFADFATGEVPGRLVCSTQRLRRELLKVAPVLGIDVGDDLSDEEAERLNALISAEEGPWIELAVWLSHWEAARLSIAHNTAIVYT